MTFNKSARSQAVWGHQRWPVTVERSFRCKLAVGSFNRMRCDAKHCLYCSSAARFPLNPAPLPQCKAGKWTYFAHMEMSGIPWSSHAGFDWFRSHEKQRDARHRRCWLFSRSNESRPTAQTVHTIRCLAASRLMDDYLFFAACLRYSSHQNV